MRHKLFLSKSNTNITLPGNFGNSEIKNTNRFLRSANQNPREHLEIFLSHKEKGNAI